jgi:hypothetical protein
MARKNEDRCFVRAGENEMLFVLRAQDVSAPKHVLSWLADNIETVTDEHAREALETALTMKREGNNGFRKNPD